MSAAGLHRETAAGLSARLAAGEVSSVEITRSCLERIETVDPVVHAFLHLDGEDALRQAGRATFAGPPGRAGGHSREFPSP